MKSPEAYKTISEVSELLDVPSHVLRFWESKFSQVRPMKRGGGRRYYRHSDVEALKQIRALLYEQGYTIKGAQNVLGRKAVAPSSSLPDAKSSPTSSDAAQMAGITQEHHAQLSHAASLLASAQGRIDALMARLTSS